MTKNLKYHYNKTYLRQISFYPWLAQLVISNISIISCLIGTVASFRRVMTFGICKEPWFFANWWGRNWWGRGVPLLAFRHTFFQYLSAASHATWLGAVVHGSVDHVRLLSFIILLNIFYLKVPILPS